MKSKFQFVLGASLLFLMCLAPAYAYASHKSGTAHTRTQTYHDRTPRAHVHGSHPHHG